MSTESDPQSRHCLAQCLGSQQSKRTDTPKLPPASVWDWVSLDLCLVRLEGDPSLITRQVEGCDCLIHHLCQAKWASAKEGCEAHDSSRKLCAHHHPACLVDRPSRAASSSPPAATLGSSNSTVSTLTTTPACVSPRHEQSTRTDTPKLPTASVCNWACLDLCLVYSRGGPSLITCQVKGCDCLLHHMCQTEWESTKEGHKVHGSRKLCAHHHPACLVDRLSCAAFSSPPTATLGSIKSTMSTLKTNISSCPATTPRSSKSTMSTLKLMSLVLLPLPRDPANLLCQP
jgi:hypothetical protein